MMLLGARRAAFLPHAERKDESDHVKGRRYDREPGHWGRVVVRVGTEDSEGQLLEVDTYVRPGGAVTGEYIHPAIEESFTVVRGRVGFRLNGRESIAELDRPLRVPAGTAHDWWNAGEEEAHIIVEIRRDTSHTDFPAIELVHPSTFIGAIESVAARPAPRRPWAYVSLPRGLRRQ